MRELSVAEQRYQAVLAVISDGLSVSQVAVVGVSRQTLHAPVSVGCLTKHTATPTNDFCSLDQSY
jgi:hypothetical protein